MIIDKNKKLMTIYAIVILMIIITWVDPLNKIEQTVHPTVFFIINAFNLFICWWSEKQSIGLPDKHNFSLQNAFYIRKLFTKLSTKRTYLCFSYFNTYLFWGNSCMVFFENS
jgi:uncharacterized membrane protein (DUF4010 family)